MTRSGLETNSSWDVSRGKEKVPLLQWICWVQKSGPIVFFHVCYHVGGSTKHLRRLKVKRRDEESSPSDALTPKKRKTRLAGKMRTYLWACPLTATSQPHLPFPCFCKIKMRGSQVAYCMRKSFLELFARLQSRDINDMSLNPFTWRWQFYWLKKKAQDMFCSRMRAWIFCVKRCTI